MPLGLFMVVYLWTAASAMAGREAFEAAWAEWTTQPFAWAIQWFGFWLPLGFHAAFGLKIFIQGRPNLGKYPHARNLMYVLQRWSGLFALALIGFHAWRFEFSSSRAAGDVFGQLCGDLSSTHYGLPLMAAAYLVGLAGIVFHLSNGLYGFCRTWGIVADQRAGRRLSAWFGVLGIALYAVAASTVIYFATGSTIAVAPRVAAATSGCGDEAEATLSTELGQEAEQ